MLWQILVGWLFFGCVGGAVVAALFGIFYLLRGSFRDFQEWGREQVWLAHGIGEDVD